MSADDDIVAAAKRGDTSAWHQLYEAHAGRLIVWLRTMPSGDAAASAEDIAADAWLTAASKVAQFHGTQDEFAGWLFGIARKASANVRRRSLRRRTTPAWSPEEHLDAASEDEAPIVQLEWIRSLLSGLAPRERDVVVCLDVVGLDVRTTATALDLSENAVRVAHHRGLARLRRSQEPASTSSAWR